MTAFTAALPRLRLRIDRRRPPSARRIFHLLWMANCLSIIAQALIVRNGLAVVLAAGYSLMYALDRAAYRRATEAEQRGDVVPPPGRLEWAMSWGSLL